jgi:16S rRNA (cytosine967-C5)-methyltransferase
MAENFEKKSEQRRWAMHALTQVLSDGRMLDDALADVPAEQRAWVHEVVAGSLRWKGRLDWIIDQLSLKKRPTGGIRKALLLASYQLLNQPSVPQAWIVSETVDWVRGKEGEAASKFVNALLRRISDHVESWRTLEWPNSAPEAEQAKWASLPEWIWRRVVRDHGRDWARAYAQASLDRPSFWLRSREPVESATRGPLEDSWKLESWHPVQDSPQYASGQLFVQDISSQVLISEFTDEVRRAWGTIEKRSVLDLCAAPGGKSTGLSWNGWRVLATDRQADTRSSRARFELLVQTAERINAGTAGPGRIEVVDRKDVDALGAQDAVWVDAPCTGSGLLRRHPEIRWIKDEKALVSLQREQVALLREAAGRVRQGGMLMYTVCSVLRSDEVEAVIRQAGLEGFEKVRTWSLSPHLEPFGDGFSGVLFRRVAPVPQSADASS